MTKKHLISKYPYLGYSPNLIEYYGIIGYQEEFVPKIIQETIKGSNPYPPTILNSIISNIDYGTMDNNLMLTQIYPDNPPIIKEDNYNQIPSPTNIIYSFCFDSQDGKKKLFYTCYAYKFYEIYKVQNNNNIYYIPKAFAIISQYAFFNTFHYICQNLEKIINLKKMESLPIEIIIFSLLNYLPTPMNYQINLNVFDILIKTDKLKLEQLSGYPYIDFDLGEIFNLIPSSLLIEIYLITFLEQKILFFSQNLEILNLLMYIMFSLNYPCNDSIYFWHIVSITSKNFTDDNKFVGKLQNSLLGVNAIYEEKLDTSSFGPYYFIIDLDNKKLFLKYNKEMLGPEEQNDINNLFTLQSYIQNCIKDKNVESFFLKQFIKELKNEVDNIITKEQYYYGKNVDFFKINPKIKETNKKIQEIFYNFNLNILMMFYNDNELNTSYDKVTNIENKTKNELRFRGNMITLCDNELLFCNIFRESIKYKVYYENFIQNFDSIDIFKIPLLFSDEFINIKLKERNPFLSKLSFFNIIDTLYCQSMPISLNVSINNLFNEYSDKLIKHFKHLVFNKNKTKRQLFILDRKILNKFIYLLANQYENQQIIELFPSLKLRTSDFIASIDQRSIKDVVKNYFINSKIISNFDYILYSVLYIFAMSLTLHPFKLNLNLLGEILHCFNDINIFVRYHINIVLQSFYKYFLINLKDNSYPEMSFDQMKIYLYFIANYIKVKGIIPDEEMMLVLTNFFGNQIRKEREKKIINKNIKQENIIQENSDKNRNKQNKIGNDLINDNVLLQNNEDFFQIKFKYNFFCFVKHAFTNNEIISSKYLAKQALNISSYLNMTLLIKEKIKLTPIIVVKIKEYIDSAKIYSPKKLLQDITVLFSDFSENFNYDLKQVNIPLFRSIIINLIFYGLEVTDVQIPFDFLIYTLYAVKDMGNKNDNLE